MTTEAFMRVRDLVCQLSLQEKLYLLNDLAMQVIQQSTARASWLNYHHYLPFILTGGQATCHYGARSCMTTVAVEAVFLDTNILVYASGIHHLSIERPVPLSLPMSRPIRHSGSAAKSCGNILPP
jgi:hypothetical protein